jgi:hypothetical protein
MDKLKAHLKQYGRLHLIAIVFIAGVIWQVVNDYQWAVQHKTDWQTTEKVLLFHATFISLYFAVWVGRAIVIYFRQKGVLRPAARTMVSLLYASATWITSMGTLAAFIRSLEP